MNANEVHQVSLSLTMALIILFARYRFPAWAVYASSPAMLVIILGARQYIKQFWTPTKNAEGKDVGTKIPLLPSMEDYNVAVQRTEDLLKVLEYLEYSWLLTTIFTYILGQKWVG